MPDITMCTGGSCVFKAKCYRHTAKPNEFRQTYFSTPPVDEDFGGNDNCTYFLSNDEAVS